MPHAVVEALMKPITLNFLFIGSKGSGQTSLLLWDNPTVSFLGDIPSLTVTRPRCYSRSSNGYFPDV